MRERGNFPKIDIESAQLLKPGDVRAPSTEGEVFMFHSRLGPDVSGEGALDIIEGQDGYTIGPAVNLRKTADRGKVTVTYGRFGIWISEAEVRRRGQEHVKK